MALLCILCLSIASLQQMMMQVSIAMVNDNSICQSLNIVENYLELKLPQSISITVEPPPYGSTFSDRLVVERVEGGSPVRYIYYLRLDTEVFYEHKQISGSTPDPVASYIGSFQVELEVYSKGELLVLNLVGSDLYSDRVQRREVVIWLRNTP